MARHSTRTVRTTPLLGGVLVGGALAAGVFGPWSTALAQAAPSDPTCVAVTQRQDDLDQAKAAYTKQKAVAAAAQAKYQRLQADLKATDAAIEAARLDSVEAGQLSYKLYSAQNSASLALNEAVGAAKGHDCHGDTKGGGEGGGKTGSGGGGGKTGSGGGGDKGGPGHGGPGHGRPGHGGPGHGRPGHGWGHPGPTPPRPVSEPVSIQSSSSATASTGPVIVTPAASTSPSGDSSSWTTGWFDGWFGDAAASGGGGDGLAAGAPGEVGAAVDGSLVPAGSVSAGDGSGGLDAGHIGMAVAGLGALGLTSAGTAALVGRRHRQQRS